MIAVACKAAAFLFIPYLKAVNQNNTLEQSSKVALATMFVLLVGALLFYKERGLFLDCAHINFRIINLGHIQLQEHRYGSFITQVVPYVGAMLHLSLRTIIIAYSVSFNLFYCIVALLLIYRYKAYGLAILLAFYNTLFISDAYFWTNNEVHQGTAWLLLFFALSIAMAKSERPVWLQLPVFILFGVIAIFSHPLIMISLLFLWGFFMMDKNIRIYSSVKQNIFFSLVVVLLVLVKLYISNGGGYDEGKMHNATHTTLPAVLHTFSSEFGKTFLRDCLHNYWWAIVILLISIAVLVQQRRFAQLSWMLICAIGFYILMALTYGDGPYDRHVLFYMESEWATLSIIIAAPFVFYFLPLLKPAKGILLLSAVFITRIVYIGLSAPLFSERIAFLEQGLRSMRARHLTKVVVVKDSRLEDKVLMDWGMPVETMMLSKLDGDNPQLTMVAIAQNDLATKVPTENQQMLDCFDLLKYPLKAEYFVFDTTRPYTILHYDDLFQPGK